MKIRCPPCSHVPGSSIGDYVAIYVVQPPRTKTSRRSTSTSQSNPITFRTLMFVISRLKFRFLFIVNSPERNGQAFISIFEISCTFRRITEILYYIISKILDTLGNYLHFLKNYDTLRKKKINKFIYL